MFVSAASVHAASCIDVSLAVKHECSRSTSLYSAAAGIALCCYTTSSTAWYCSVHSTINNVYVCCIYIYCWLMLLYKQHQCCML
jgi:hypothetical protein